MLSCPENIDKRVKDFQDEIYTYFCLSGRGDFIILHKNETDFSRGNLRKRCSYYCKTTMAQSVFIRKSESGKGMWKYHILALVTALIWSTTFVSTKVLLNEGMTPETIFVTRFAIAYLLIICIFHSKLMADSLKDEALLCLAGLTGGSLYFLTENTALKFTYASNVSILISAIPLLTIALSAWVFRQKFHKSMLFGSLLALSGVALVVFNGNATFKVAPIGDLLTLAAAMCWASYSVVLKYLGNHSYSTLFITRKVFFYGLVSMLLYLPFSGVEYDFHLLSKPEVYGNILFLGVVASFGCFIVWNRIVEELGPDKANNYIYISPLGTITTAIIFLHEPITWMALIGAAITICGVVIVERLR